ncbi:hypothetical protein LAZ67_3003150 [Cordylochernes scorpioides]|uniref:Peptidase C1A papain C-terminal domain-containing protein n=1 Tax=Cordylochernes scorpioides TaxID=51811 RepID=A0ABY6K8C1_9ARAC|nr:hypothetical protein LAZ67_3003150 [Cordylochernes scorpioides]
MIYHFTHSVPMAMDLKMAKITGFSKTDIVNLFKISSNFWEKSWGEDGYIRMSRNKNNQCGIVDMTIYQIV